MSGSILQNVDKIIDESLGLRGCGMGKEPHFHHKAICQKLVASPPPNFDAKDLIEKIYEQVLSNWNGKHCHSPSGQNWRFESCTSIAEGNGSPEVKLERAILKAQFKPHSWANQVPTSSGLLGQDADTHRNIDLIHRCKEGVYEFIELKVESNTPLHAAMEILQNAVLYIFYREHREQLEREAKKPKPLLDATIIHLRVLAPSSYYEGYDLAWLEAKICQGLTAYLATKMPYIKMDFRFDAFHPSFTVDHARAIIQIPSEEARLIRTAVDDREPLYPS